MTFRPYWQFYKTIFPFVAAFGVVGLAVFGVFWGYFLFSTVALGIGFIGFHNFRKDEYYTYYNLGITQWKLAKVSFLINLVVGVPIFLVFLSLFLVIFGTTTIT